jgi:rhodanese-related sulfurtransferase
MEDMQPSNKPKPEEDWTQVFPIRDGYLKTMHRVSAWLVIILIASCVQSPPIENAERAAQVRKKYLEFEESLGQVPVMSPQEAFELSSNASILLIDARTREEQKVCIIPGAMPAQDFNGTDVNGSRPEKLLVYCTIGYRSGKLAEKYLSEGYDAYNIEGGILGWLHAGLPVQDAGGQTARKVHVYGDEWNLAPIEYEPVF